MFIALPSYLKYIQVFNIHPLTTEDIQMEETREKIELFRNYYFVCFRSFDQDQYSPTYLEPLNMYIIVFREGILSVRSSGITFGFRLKIENTLVPFPSHSSPPERQTENQTVEGLHFCHVRLDIICFDRRHH